MRTLKIAFLSLFAAGILWACDNPEYVSRNEYEQLLQEYAQLQEAAEATRAQYAEQAAAVDQILRELSQISGRTISLRADMEHGAGELTQVQQIEESIADIKQQLARLDDLSKQTGELQKLVTSLRAVVAQKDQEIEALKAEITRRDATIDEQHRTINEQSGKIEDQSQVITRQQENLQALLAEQAQVLFQAGVDFENLGDNTPDMHGGRDKRNQKAYRKEMYEKALYYYSQAQQAGYQGASFRVGKVQEKINEL